MLALLDPSRQDIPEYAEYLGAIQRAARAVNDRFQRGRLDAGRPAHRGQLPASVAAYKQYDVLLVNAIFDGLNLVAKEGPLVNERDGVLILSENAGAHEELGAVGALRQSVRHRGAGAGDPRGDRDAARGAARAGSEAIRAHVADARRGRLARDASSRISTASRSVPGGRRERRALARRRAGRVRMVDVGGKAAVAAAGGRARDACAWRRRRRGGCASCRRATRSRPRSSPGSWRRSGRAS